LADKALKDINIKLKRIDDSLLAPWQKLDAMCTFILPGVSFHLRNGVVQKEPLNAIERHQAYCQEMPVPAPVGQH
jgi:hypothetical protein